MISTDFHTKPSLKLSHENPVFSLIFTISLTGLGGSLPPLQVSCCSSLLVYPPPLLVSIKRSPPPPPVGTPLPLGDPLTNAFHQND